MEKSFDCRMALNVLQKNKPFNYYIDLLKELKLPKLTDDSILIIDKYALKKLNFFYSYFI